MYTGLFISLVGAIRSYCGVRDESARRDRSATLVVSCVTAQGKSDLSADQTRRSQEEESDCVVCVHASGAVVLVHASSAASEMTEGRIIN